MAISQGKKKVEISKIEASNKIEANKTSVKSPATIITKKAIMSETAPSQKTSNSFGNLHISDC